MTRRNDVIRYGEDPYLISRVGVTAMLSLQNRTSNGYMMTTQTTRHFIGYHQTQMVGKPDVIVTDRDLYDQFLPAYKAYQTEGGANGIMCGYAAFDGVPSCGNKRLLQTILRDEWNATSMVQSDCCNSVNSIWSLHGYTKTLEAAVALALNTGTDLCYEYDTLSRRRFVSSRILAGCSVFSIMRVYDIQSVFTGVGGKTLTCAIPI